MEIYDKVLDQKIKMTMEEFLVYRNQLSKKIEEKEEKEEIKKELSYEEKITKWKNHVKKLMMSVGLRRKWFRENMGLIIQDFKFIEVRHLLGIVGYIPNAETNKNHVKKFCTENEHYYIDNSRPMTVKYDPERMTRSKIEITEKIEDEKVGEGFVEVVEGISVPKKFRSMK